MKKKRLDFECSLPIATLRKVKKVLTRFIFVRADTQRDTEDDGNQEEDADTDDGSSRRAR